MSDLVIAVLRAIHISFGAFWLGGTLTVGFFLIPAFKAAGPVGGQFAVQLMARTRLLTAITAAGAIAVIAGFILYGSIWAGTGFGGPARWYAFGGFISILAIIFAAAVIIPAAHKLRALTATLVTQQAPPTLRQNAERGRLIDRVKWASQVSSFLLVVTITLMAIGRYV